MRTARVLTVSPSMLCVGAVYLVPGGYLVGGCTWSLGGCTWSQRGVPGPRRVSDLGVSDPRGVPGPGGVYLILGGCTWSQGAPGPGGCTWSGGCTSSWGCTWSLGGVPGPGGAPGPGGVPGAGGVRYSPSVNRMTNRCKNITLPQTSFAGGNNISPYPEICGL